MSQQGRSAAAGGNSSQGGGDYPTEYNDIVNEINAFIASLDAPPLDSHTKELVGDSAPAPRKLSREVGGGGLHDHTTRKHPTGHRGDVDEEEKTLPFPTVEELDSELNHYDYLDSADARGVYDYQEYKDPNVAGSTCSAFAEYNEASTPVSKQPHHHQHHHEQQQQQQQHYPSIEQARSVAYAEYSGHPKSDSCSINQGHYSHDPKVKAARTLDYGDYSVPPHSSGSSSIDTAIRSGGQFADYSDSSNYSMVSESSSYSGGDPADSDSGCYSQYHHHQPVQPYYQEPRQLHHEEQMAHFPNPGSSGCLRTPPLSSPSHIHPRHPDRESAEFLCDPLQHSFDQVGSSAHTLAQHARTPYEDHDYQAPSNIPKLPTPKTPSSITKTSEVTSSPGPIREGTYSVISKPSPPVSPKPVHKSPGVRGRWPPPSEPIVPKEVDPVASPGKNRWRPEQKQRPQIPVKPQSSKPDRSDSPSARTASPLVQPPSLKLSTTTTSPSHTTPHKQGGIPIPISHVPDLSLLISELRSASPQSQPSPSPPTSYTSSARSESLSPCSHTRSRIDSQSPKTTSSESSSHSLSNGVGCRSSSPDHDYELIENLQLEVPPTPRPQPKFPHPPGRAMADGAQSGGQQPKHVKALHNFVGNNNDELCFKRGDIITVTQCVEGGWWEGTLNGRTGWFPSNYVKEVKADISFKNSKTGDVPVYKRESMQLYHNVVLKNVIETEKTHVSELINVLQSYVKPIEGTNILNPPEFKLLLGNLEEIIAFQQSFLSALEECEKLPSSQRRIGGIFMQFATRVKEMYSLYCANHPKAVAVLQKHREELSKFVESVGAPVPGAQTLTTILSKPFTRLDKYPSLLKELERHVEESHPDRGDTQRAIAVYRNIANACLEIRKLKEMEHEIITSTIQGWEGEEITKLGEVQHLSQVKMLTQTGEKYERIFVLFPSCLLMLSMSERLSSYQYEGKIPLSGLLAKPLESLESLQQGFEISGPMIEKIKVICGTKTEASQWLDALNHQLSQTSGNPSITSSAKPQPLQVHMISTCQPSVSTVTPAKTAQISSSHHPSVPASGPPAPTGPPPHFSSKTACVWSLTCLRPSPPRRPSLMCREEVLKSPRAARKSTQKRKPVRTYSGEDTDWHSKNDPKVYNEDAFILQVIEAYCNSVKTRHTVNSCKIELAKKKPIALKGKAILNSPQILLAEEEKVFDETEQQERTVVDTVYALQDRVKELEQEQRKLRQDLEEERHCRKKLEMLVQQQIIKSGVVDGVDGVPS